MLEKCVLVVTGAGAKEACGTEQLCGGPEAGIDGGDPRGAAYVEKHDHEEDWGFLLIDARNAFNEENRTAMLWAVRHKWPSGARFAFNCYYHWSIMAIRAGDGMGNFLFSKEGVTQGDPLAMVTYGLGILPPHLRIADVPPRRHPSLVCR